VNIRSVKELHPGCTPECGIYPNVPASLYFSLTPMNHSTLKLMKQSPKHFKYQERKGVGDGARLGTAAHTLLFEPEKFKPIPPPINKTTGRPFASDTKAWAEYAAANPNALIISDDEVNTTRELVSELKAHSKLGPVLTEPTGLNEVVLVWDDELTGIRCKAKLDRYVPGFGVVDLKTVDISIGAKSDGFVRQAINFFYHSAQAFYQSGMRACGLTDTTFLFGVVESARPFGIVTYSLGQPTLRCGGKLINGWLRDLEYAQRTGVWKGYSDDITVLEAPEWYLRMFDEGNRDE